MAAYPDSLSVAPIWATILVIKVPVQLCEPRQSRSQIASHAEQIRIARPIKNVKIEVIPTGWYILKHEPSYYFQARIPDLT